MKKLFFVASIILSTSLIAQDKTNSKDLPVSFGVKGGLNISSLSGNSDIVKQNSKVGFNAGVFANIPIAKSFSLQPELLFTQYGNKESYNLSVDNDLYVNRSYSTNLGYIALPLMLQYNFIPNLYIEAGVELGLNIIAKEKFDESLTFSGNTNISNGTVDIDKDRLNTFNFGIGLGSGYYFNDNIGITARYVAGLTEVYKNSEFTLNPGSTKNNVFQIGLAYKF